MVRWKDSSSTIWRSSARLDRRLPRARLRELARRLRPHLARRPPQIPAKGRDAAGGARLPRARWQGSETDDAVPPGRQYLGGPRRRRFPGRVLWPARLHLRERGLLRAVHARRDAGDRLPARLPDRADDLCRRRPRDPPGGRRLWRDERLQRVRAGPAPREIHWTPACRRGARRPRLGARRSRSRSPARPQGPLLLAGFLAARLRAQCRPRRVRAVLGEDRPPQAAGLRRAFIDAELRRGGLPGEPARARAAPEAPSRASFRLCDGSAGRVFRARREMGDPGRGARSLSPRQSRGALRIDAAGREEPLSLHDIFPSEAASRACLASSRSSFRIPVSIKPAGANRRSNRRRRARAPAVYRSFGRGARAAFSTTSATTPGSSAAASTSFICLPKATRTSRYSSSLESGSRKFASNCVFVYAGSTTVTRMPLVRSSWSSDSE